MFEERGCPLYVYFVPVCFYSIFVPFHIALQIQYYVNDKHKSFAIDYGKRCVVLRKKNQLSKIAFDDIKCVEYFKGSKYPMVWGRDVIP